MMREHERNVIADAIDGAIAGLVATWVMGKVTSLLYEREDVEARRREDDARGGRTAYAVAAEKGARLIGLAIPEDRREAAGSRLHWALGIGTGAAYGIMRSRLPFVDRAGGLLFGTAFFLAVDEIGTTVLRLTPPPTAFPWQAHARGLAGHLTYGAVANAVARL
jgi:hypothetical protein